MFNYQLDIKQSVQNVLSGRLSIETESKYRTGIFFLIIFITEVYSRLPISSRGALRPTFLLMFSRNANYDASWQLPGKRKEALEHRPCTWPDSRCLVSS